MIQEVLGRILASNPVDREKLINLLRDKELYDDDKIIFDAIKSLPSTFTYIDLYLILKKDFRLIAKCMELDNEATRRIMKHQRKWP